MAKIVKKVVATAYDLDMRAKTCVPYEVSIDLVPGQLIKMLGGRQLTRSARPGGKDFYDLKMEIDGEVETIVSTLDELQSLQLAVCEHNLNVLEELYV